ncbi:MAG: HAD family hydrolase [Chloroflexota bacterium]|nr:HAD family hydrolase [Chloroflexota bacterium]MDE2898327.1 HAD family hydrolase [Chloroflexota bacterium]
MPESPVKAVFFDIDDTLVDDAAATRAGAMGLFDRYRDRLGGCDERLMQRWIALLDHHFERYLRGESSFIGQRRARIRDLFGLTPDQMPDAEVDAIHEVYRAFYYGTWRLFPDALATLDALDGYRLGVISNGTSAQQRQKLAAVGVLDRFAAVMISEDIGVAKPDPEIFEAACQAVGASPSACVHVGDRLDTDARGARDAGLTGVWLNRRGQDAGTSDVPMIERLSELPALVTRRRAS